MLLATESGITPVMLILGIILIVIGAVVPKVAVLFTIGLILAIIGLVLMVLPTVGGPTLGGRRWY